MPKRKRVYLTKIHDRKVEIDNESIVMGYAEQRDKPKDKTPWSVWVDPRLRGVTSLDVTCHELLHMLFPKEKETTIDYAGTKLAEILWALGWRRR